MTMRKQVQIVLAFVLLILAGVMSRGDRREDIFLDDVDRRDFLKTLAEACQKTDWQVHAFCLMRNHYHLVVETPNANLVAGMAWLQSTYTIRLKWLAAPKCAHCLRLSSDSTRNMKVSEPCSGLTPFRLYSQGLSPDMKP